MHLGTNCSKHTHAAKHKINTQKRYPIQLRLNHSRRDKNDKYGRRKPEPEFPERFVLRCRLSDAGASVVIAVGAHNGVRTHDLVTTRASLFRLNSTGKRRRSVQARSNIGVQSPFDRSVFERVSLRLCVGLRDPQGLPTLRARHSLASQRRFRTKPSPALTSHLNLRICHAFLPL